jgi:hypothetical protein
MNRTSRFRLESDASGTLPQGFPVETEIYILPDGQVVFADLPQELAGLRDSLGSSETTSQAESLSGFDHTTLSSD